MGHVAMHRPITGLIGNKFESARLADGNQHCCFHLLRRLRNLAAVGFGYSELISVQVNRMMFHYRDAGDANANAIAQLCHHRFRRRENFRVKSEDVEVCHLVRIRSRCAGVESPLAEHEREIPVRTLLFWPTRMNDEQAHCAERHLGHLIAMRVVHVRPMLTQCELVAERLARLNVLLC